MPGACITVDTARFPLIMVSFRGDFSDAQFDRYLDDLTRVIERPRRRVLVFDTTFCGAVTASHRRKQATWMKAHLAAIHEHTLGVAFVLPSALMRGALTAILWVQPLDAPHVVVENVKDAMDKVEAWLATAGMKLG